MAINNNWSIDYTYKRIYHSSGVTVFSVNALYSYLQDTFDEGAQMDNDIPMTAQTPTSYTMVNGWFIDDESVKYLNGGSIATNGYSGSIRVITLNASGYTNAVAGDITKVVTQAGSGDTGRLLYYDNTQRKWWIRPDNTANNGDVFWASGTSQNMTIGSGTGAGTNAVNTLKRTTGEALYANLYTLGTIESTPPPSIYIFQSGSAISEWSTLSNWKRGHVDVLLRVQEAGQVVGDGSVTVFARQYGDLYDHFNISLTAGGRNAVPISTAVDLNNTTGEFYLLWDNGATFTPYAGAVVSGSSASGGPTAFRAEVVSAVDNGSNGYLTLGGMRGTVSDNLLIGLSGSRHGRSALTNGFIGDTLLTVSNASSFAALHQIVTGGTTGAKRALKGVDTTSNYLNLRSYEKGLVSGSAHYLRYNSGETVTGAVNGSSTASANSTSIVSGYSDTKIVFVNGHATVTGAGNSGTFTAFEPVTWTNGSAVFIDLTGSLLTLGNIVGKLTALGTVTGTLSGATRVVAGGIGPQRTFNKAFTQQTAYPYDVLVDCAGRTLAQTYEYFKFVTRQDSVYQMYPSGGYYQKAGITALDGQEYIVASPSYSPVKASPLGTYAGGRLFGARGVWLQNMASSDVQSFQLADANGTTRTPPNFITIRVSSVVAGDSVAVFQTSGGLINKAQFTSGAGNSAGDGDFVVNAAIPSDTPSSGSLRTVKVSDGSEVTYGYSSWTGSTFTLGSGYLLSRTYTNGTDTAYVGYIDKKATTTVAEDTVIYSTDRNVVVRVRKKGIIPFESPSSVTSTGMTVAAIRTVDSIVT